VAWQRRRRRVVLDVVRHDRVEGHRLQAAACPGRYYATALALLSRGVMHQRGRGLLGLERHLTTVVHLVRAVIGCRAVIRRRLARARVHGLDLLLIVSLIVATPAAATTGAYPKASRAPDTDDAAGLHLLLVASTAASATAATDADVLSLLAQVIGVMGGVVVLVLVVVMLVVRATEKVRRTHVVLHVAVVVRRRVLGFHHHHLVHLRRLMVRKRVVREKRIHRWRIQYGMHFVLYGYYITERARIAADS